MLQERWLKVDWINTGSLRGDLSDLCGMLFHHFAGSEKKLGFHLQLNMARYEAVAQALSPYTDEVKARARSIFPRAIDRARGRRQPRSRLLD